MLVGVIKFIQLPQGILIEGGPSLVRLEVMDQCLGGRRNVLFESAKLAPHTRLWPSARLFRSRKALLTFRPFPTTGNALRNVGCLCVCDDHLIDQMIKDGSELVGCFTGPNGEMHGQLWWLAAQIECNGLFRDGEGTIDPINLSVSLLS